MDQDRYRRLRRLFAEARRLDAETRGAWLERECADDRSLLHEVQALLAHDRTSGDEGAGTLGARVAEAMNDLDPIVDAALPRQVGRYRILGILGEGGMGTVYRAEQVSPIQREVALKLMRDGLLSAAFRARFETERQTLARMDHPNIAKVFDADYDERGRPYLGMELIDGLPVTEHCQQRGLSVRDRLALFLDVCRGVGHAHRKGVIHRDLKPSNILVKDSRQGGVPKLIDFSIAKTLQESPTDDEQRTRTGQVIGTLDYMSPEQARGEIAAVDTRSDVYSLGVVAYELLAGHPPLRLGDLPIHEAVRRVSRDEAPSLKTTTGGATGTDRVPADVVTIIEKCLAKDPERRYRNADELADDLERFLTSRPILARPPTTMYQLRLLVGRHRVAFAGATMLVAFLVVYGVTVSVQLRAQRAERLRAEAAAEQARREARRATRVLGFMQDILASGLPTGDGPAPTVRELLDRSARRIDAELAADPEALGDAHHALGQSYGGLGDYDRSLEHMGKALELHAAAAGEDSRSSLRDRIAIVGDLHLSGNYDDASRQGHPLLKLLREREDEGSSPLPPEEIVDFQVSLSNIETDHRQFDEAEALARDALRRAGTLDLPEDSTLMASTREGLAFALWSRGGDERLQESEQLMHLALADLESRLGPTHPQTIMSLNQLAVILQSESRGLEAAALQKDILDRMRLVYEPGHPAIAVGAHNLASTLLNLGWIAAAEPYQREALENWRETLGPNHSYVGIAIQNVAFMQQCLGNLDEAERLYREAIATAGEGSTQAREVAECNLTFTLRDAGRSLDEAEVLSRRCVERAERDAGRGSTQWDREATNLGFLLLQGGRPDEAERLFREAADSLTALKHPAQFQDLGLALLLERRGDRAEAARFLGQAGDALLRGEGAPENSRFLLTRGAALADGQGNAELAESLRAELRARDERMRSTPELEAVLQNADVADRSR